MTCIRNTNMELKLQHRAQPVPNGSVGTRVSESLCCVEREGKQETSLVYLPPPAPRSVLWEGATPCSGLSARRHPDGTGRPPDGTSTRSSLYSRFQPHRCPLLIKQSIPRLAVLCSVFGCRHVETPPMQSLVGLCVGDSVCVCVFRHKGV